VLTDGGETEEEEEIVFCAEGEEGEIEGEEESIPLTSTATESGGGGALGAMLSALLRERGLGVTIEVDFVRGESWRRVEVEREGRR